MVGMQAGGLVAACERYAAEAGRLEPAHIARPLAQQFSDLQAHLEGMLAQRR